MLLSAQNNILIEDQPSTILTSSIAVGATTLTVKNNEGFSQNDYVLIGKVGEDKTEIKLINAAVTLGTSITVAATTFAHDEDTPVTKVDYNQVQFAHATTSTGAKTALTTKALTPGEDFTIYEDITYTTGYGFCRFYDSNGTNYSGYSDAIPYTGYTDKMLRSIRDKVRRLLNEPSEEAISDIEIDEELNLAQREIAHDRLWSFYEKTKSFSSVANQYEYSLASDVFVLYDGIYDTQPLAVIDLHRWNNLRWDSDTKGDPTHICIWRKKAKVYPYPSSSAGTTVINDTDGITAADTTITVDSTSGFQSQGRIVIESEVISYTGKTTTTFTGCSRGEEGTTAATHADDITVTERDFIYHFQEEPENLVYETDETLITEPSEIAYKTAAELALYNENETLHDRLIIKFDRGMKQLRKLDEPKIKVSFGRVKNLEETVSDQAIWKDPNLYPKDLTD